MWRASGLVEQVRKQPRARFAIAAAALALAATAPFGGLDRVAPASDVDVMKPGDTIDAHPFDLTVVRASAVTEIKGVASPSDKANRLLLLYVNAVNVTDEPAPASLLGARSKSTSGTDAKNLVVLDDAVASTRGATVYIATDASLPRILNPDLTYHLVLVWEFAGPVPTDLNLGVSELVNDFDEALGSQRWQDPVPVARLTVPVADKTGVVQ